MINRIAFLCFLFFILTIFSKFLQLKGVNSKNKVYYEGTFENMDLPERLTQEEARALPVIASVDATYVKFDPISVYASVDSEKGNE